MFLSRIRYLASTLPLLAGLFPSAAQSVIVVDATGAGDFTDLQPAVDAAVAGDVVLVRSVLVAGATIDGKGLTLVGETGDAPNVGRLSVVNVPAGQTVTLRHVRSLFPGNMFEAMKLEGNLGAVFVEDVVTAGDSSGAFQLAATGLRVTDCASVVVNNCNFSGGNGSDGSPYWPAKAGGYGLACTDSNLSATWTNFLAGGGAGGFFGPAPAGDGINATGGYLFLSGSEAVGGTNVECGSCGDDFASDGLHLSSGGIAQYTDTVFLAGPPGGVSPPGQDIDAVPGTAQNLNEPRRALFVSSPLRYLEKGILIYEGAPHDRVTVFASAATGFLPVPAKAGVWQLDAPIAGPLMMGDANDVGHLKITFHAPDVAPLEGVTLFLQAAVKEEVSGTLRLGGPTTLTLIDPSI